MRRYLANEFQIPVECEQFVALLNREGVRSYLEIGSKYGGSLWQVAKGLPIGSSITAVDSVWSAELSQCVQDIRAIGQDVKLIIGDSTDLRIVESVRLSAPFDAILIDGNHFKMYVEKDWKNYSSMGDIIAFHDIGMVPVLPKNKPWKQDVALFWNSIKENYRHVEIKSPGDHIGFGVLWR